jgi:DNA-binding MarR family transcriptional regulator
MQRTSLSTDPYYDLWKLLNETRDAILKTRETELAQFDLSAMQARVLFFVQAADEPTTPAQLSRWLFRESQSVSGLLTRMEKQGLIKRVKDLDKKNQVRIVITEKGRQAYSQSTRRKSIQRIMSSLSEEERQRLKSYLQILKDKAVKELAMVRQQFRPYSK